MSEKLKFNPEKEKKDKLLYWGKGNPAYDNHSTYLECLKDDCKLYNKMLPTNKWDECTVGVKEAPYKSGDNHLARVIECPCCFEKYWFHLDDETADKLYNKNKS